MKEGEGKKDSLETAPPTSLSLRSLSFPFLLFDIRFPLSLSSSLSLSPSLSSSVPPRRFRMDKKKRAPKEEQTTKKKNIT